jgi:hypothetical protein
MPGSCRPTWSRRLTFLAGGDAKSPAKVTSALGWTTSKDNLSFGAKHLREEWLSCTRVALPTSSPREDFHPSVGKQGFATP